ncbi:MAG: methylenetetrahydrofolate reductase [Nitrospira sp.]|nr:methylenetetrahydrofolate reductase [Nitrospira sp.]
MKTHQSTLHQMLVQGQFAVTVELNPPKGTDVSELLETAKSLSGRVHGINVPDNAAAVMRASPVAVARLLYEQGHDPVLQLTCRDRNRIGLQSDLLGAHVLGIRNVLCLTGDSPSAGDHKDAKPVFDLDTVEVMRTVSELNQGRDLAGNALEGRTTFFIGGAAAPGAESAELLHKKFAAKVKAGAQFFQTQPVFSAKVIQPFMEAVRPYSRNVLAGVLVLRSVKMAEYVNAHVPGIDVPEEILQELRDARDAHAAEAGIEIAVRTIQAIRPYCDGVHVMAGRLSHRLPEIIRKAGLN